MVAGIAGRIGAEKQPPHANPPADRDAGQTPGLSHGSGEEGKRIPGDRCLLLLPRRRIFFLDSFYNRHPCTRVAMRNTEFVEGTVNTAYNERHGSPCASSDLWFRIAGLYRHRGTLDLRQHKSALVADIARGDSLCVQNLEQSGDALSTDAIDAISQSRRGGGGILHPSSDGHRGSDLSRVPRLAVSAPTAPGGILPRLRV